MAALLGTTGTVRRVYPFQALLVAHATGLAHDSKAQAEQVRSISCDRLSRRIGRVPPELMDEVDGALRLHLAL